MYTVIVADDEEEIRRGIIKRVNWEKVGFQVIGEAENGIEALELVEKLEPDLLLTDIRMPFLNGIELARQVREIRPTVQIAFLSGYDDFSYAQQAIQYNIISYMLKPISAMELEEELVKIRETIDKKFQEFAAKELVQQRMEKSEFMLPLLLDGMQEKEEKELIEEAVSCGLLTGANPEVIKYIVMVVNISDGGKDQTTRASVNAIDMILKKYIGYVSCYLKGRVVSILAATPSGFNKYLHIIVEEVVQSVERIMGYTCAIGVSRMTDSLQGSRQLYMEAMNALSYSRQTEESVHYIADEEKKESFDQEKIQNTVSMIDNLLRGGTKEEMKEFLEKFSDQISEGKMAPALAEFMITQMIASIFQTVYTVAGGEALEKLQSDFHFVNHNMVGQIMERYEQYEELCLSAKEMIAEQRKKSGELLCDKVLEIINTRYKDTELSIVGVSNEIAVSPNYLSALLKKNTGRTFVELLTNKRMEKAKELLICTAMKIREISEECGYKDQHYFSYCFKKAVGISPNQCRRENEH